MSTIQEIQNFFIESNLTKNISEKMQKTSNINIKKDSLNKKDYKEIKDFYNINEENINKKIEDINKKTEKKIITKIHKKNKNIFERLSGLLLNLSGGTLIYKLNKDLVLKDKSSDLRL